MSVCPSVIHQKDRVNDRFGTTRLRVYYSKCFRTFWICKKCQFGSEKPLIFARFLHYFSTWWQMGDSAAQKRTVALAFRPFCKRGISSFGNVDLRQEKQAKFDGFPDPNWRPGTPGPGPGTPDFNNSSLFGSKGPILSLCFTLLLDWWPLCPFWSKKPSIFACFSCLKSTLPKLEIPLLGKG